MSSGSSDVFSGERESRARSSWSVESDLNFSGVGAPVRPLISSCVLETWGEWRLTGLLGLDLVRYVLEVGQRPTRPLRNVPLLAHQLKLHAFNAHSDSHRG
jgi:hypothetical protein